MQRAKKGVPENRMKVAPVKIKSKNFQRSDLVSSVGHMTLPITYASCMKRNLTAVLIVPCGIEPSQWASKAILVPKSDGSAVRIVADFKKLNKEIKRCHWLTESSGQLLRHIVPQVKYFVSLDLTSGE